MLAAHGHVGMGKMSDCFHHRSVNSVCTWICHCAHKAELVTDNIFNIISQPGLTMRWEVLDLEAEDLGLSSRPSLTRVLPECSEILMCSSENEGNNPCMLCSLCEISCKRISWGAPHRRCRSSHGIQFYRRCFLSKRRNYAAVSELSISLIFKMWFLRPFAPGTWLPIEY